MKKSNIDSDKILSISAGSAVLIKKRKVQYQHFDDEGIEINP